MFITTKITDSSRARKLRRCFHANGYDTFDLIGCRYPLSGPGTFSVHLPRLKWWTFRGKQIGTFYWPITSVAGNNTARATVQCREHADIIQEIYQSWPDPNKPSLTIQVDE